MLRSAPLREVFYAVALGAAVGAGACDSPAEPQAGPPAALAVAAGDQQMGTVAAVLPQPLAVTVVDAGSRPVPDAPVAWAVTAGSGSVAPVRSSTDRRGIATAEVTLGPNAGAVVVTASVGALAPVTFTATAAPGAPAAIVAAAGDAQNAVVATALPDPLVIAIVDAHGNPIPDIPLTWSVVAGGGTLQGAARATDSTGHARATWRLGTAAGEQVVRVDAGGAVAASFAARALPAAAVRIDLPTDVVALGAAGDSVRVPLAAADAHGNEVPASMLTWRSLDPAIAAVDANGIVRAHADGRVRIIAASPVVSDTANIAIGPREIAGAPNFSVRGVHITQAVQTFDGRVPLVRGRTGLLRVFAQSDLANSANATVRVRIYRNGVLQETRIVGGHPAGVPTVAHEANLGGSYNIELPGSLIQPGMAVAVDVDPQDWYGESEEDDNTFPSNGAPLPLDVRTSPAFDVRFVPVHQTANGALGNVSDANKAAFLDMTTRMMPLAEIDADVRAPMLTSAPPLQSGDGNEAWLQILRELYALYVAEGSSRHYYGVVHTSYSSGIAGYGYIGAPVAMGWDHLSSGSRVAAHEFGHNWGRSHSPCGGAGNPDANYPYTGGISGVVGYDHGTRAIKPPNTTDVMGYCSNQWISDYTYRNVMTFRSTRAAQSASGSYTNALLVWGRVEKGRVTLEPAFEIATRSALPAADGPYLVEGLDAAGNLLFSLPFAPLQVADAGDHGHFAFAIPADRARTDRLAQLRVRSPDGAAVSSRKTLRSASGGRPDPAMSRRPGARGVALTWDSDAYPAALLRNADTGQIIGIARGGATLLPDAESPVDVVFSDGVRSLTRQIPLE